MKKLSVLYTLLVYGCCIIITLGAVKREAIKVIFKEELVIGAEEGDSTQVFSKPVNVVVDSKGNIYIVDMSEKIIKKFDHNGNYVLTIGHPGQGPGEFITPNIIAIDNNDDLHVADFATGRVSTFHPDGSFIGSFVPGFFCYGLVTSPQGKLIVHGFKNDKIFHTFDITGNLISSFGEMWKFSANPQLASLQPFNFAFVYKGSDQNFYACPVLKPNEILKYDFEGRSFGNIVKAAPSYAPIKWNGMRPSGGAMTKGFVVLNDGKMLVYVTVPKQRGSEEVLTSVFDIYDKQGRFLISYEPQFDGKPRWVDKEGKIYFVADEPFPRIIKGSLSFE